MRTMMMSSFHNNCNNNNSENNNIVVRVGMRWWKGKVVMILLLLNVVLLILNRSCCVVHGLPHEQQQQQQQRLGGKRNTQQLLPEPTATLPTTTISCNQVNCSIGEYCCNESCSRCVPVGDACTMEICFSPTSSSLISPSPTVVVIEPPTIKQCNQTICSDDEYCCNELCSLCVPIGDACIMGCKTDGQVSLLLRMMKMMRRFMNRISDLFGGNDDDDDGESGDTDSTNDNTTEPVGGQQCNATICQENEYCCNESCSICAPIGKECKDQSCPTESENENNKQTNGTKTKCENDWDCRIVDFPLPQRCINNQCLIVSTNTTITPPILPPVGTKCGFNICYGTDVCCNDLCGICAKDNTTCTDTPLPDWCSTITRCGPSYCRGEYKCCNETCGLCALPGETCPVTDDQCIIVPPNDTYPTLNGTGCGPTICTGDDICCNEFCGVCSNGTTTCEDTPVPDWCSTITRCGNGYCKGEYECCNETCGSCALPGETCPITDDQCFPTTPPVLPPVGTKCGFNICYGDDVCCNDLCGICAKDNTTCTDTPVPDWCATLTRCGTSYCKGDYECCNETCGLCALPGETCPIADDQCSIVLPNITITPPAFNGTSCGFNVCYGTDVCCNDLCGICAKDNTTCTDTPVPDWCATLTRCGTSYCKGDYECCNETCGQCALPGETCPPCATGSIFSCGNAICSVDANEQCCQLDRCGLCIKAGEVCPVTGC